MSEQPPSGLWSSLHDRLESERSVAGRLRSLSTWTRSLLTVITVALSGAAVWLAMLRPDYAEFPKVRLISTIMALVVAGIAAAVALLRPMQERPLSRAWMTVLLVSTFLMPVVIALLPQAHHGHPASFADAGRFWAAAAGCFLFGIVTAAPLIALLKLLDRCDRLERSRLALAAGVGGLIGNLGLSIHCPLISPIHLLAAHAPVSIGVALVIFVVGHFSVTRRAVPNSPR